MGVPLLSPCSEVETLIITERTGRRKVQRLYQLFTSRKLRISHATGYVTLTIGYALVVLKRDEYTESCERLDLPLIDCSAVWLSD